MHEIMGDAQRLSIARLVDCVSRAAIDEIPDVPPSHSGSFVSQEPAGQIHTQVFRALGIETNEAIRPETIFDHLEFAFRRSTTDARNNLDDIDSFLKDAKKHGDEIQEHLKDKKDKRIAKGLAPLLSTFRALDLLHAFVLALPVDVDFLGIYAARAQAAVAEARTTPPEGRERRSPGV